MTDYLLRHKKSDRTEIYLCSDCANKWPAKVYKMANSFRGTCHECGCRKDIGHKVFIDRGTFEKGLEVIEDSGT